MRLHQESLLLFRLRHLRETYCFSLCKLIEYSTCYSPADYADHAKEYSKLYYFAEKDRLFEVKAVLSFWGLSAIICERLNGVLCANCLSTLTCYFPADSADYAEEYSMAVLSRRERQIGMVVRLLKLCCFVVCLRNLRDLRETSEVLFVLID